MKRILALLPESQRLLVVNTPISRGQTVLHSAAESGDVACINNILSLYPESDRLQTLNLMDQYGQTVLHCVLSHSYDCIKVVLALYPESERRRALNMSCDSYRGDRRTVLKHMNEKTRHSILEWLSDSSCQKTGE